MDEDVLTILTDFGKSFENDEVWQKIEYLREIHNYSSSSIVSMLINYLNSEKITSHILTLTVITDFEKKISVNKENMDIIENKVHKSPKKSLVEPDFSFLGDYVEDEQNIILPTHSPVDLNTSTLENEMVWDEVNIDKPKFQNIDWPIIFSADTQTLNMMMFQKHSEIVDAIKKQGIEVVSNQIRLLNESQVGNNQSMSLDSLSRIGQPHLEEVTVAGRIVLNHTLSTMHLESALEMDSEFLGLEPVMNRWEPLQPDSIAIQCLFDPELNQEPLIVDQTDSYSFFPGQNVMVTGKNPSKTGFIVSRVHQKLTDQPQHIDPDSVPGPLFMAIACGPLASPDQASLASLLESIRTQRCHVLILMGPLFTHSEAAAQSLSVEDSWDQLWWTRFSEIADACIGMDTHLIYVPSPDDCIAMSQFPQPAYLPPEEFTDLVDKSFIHLAPNPAIISIGTYKFAMSSVDVLRHLSGQEISKNCSGSRLKRLCSHILAERNFYPLKPAHPEMVMDWPLWYRMCQFGPVTPHCLVLPSKLTTFKENVNNVLCINPGFLNNDKFRSTYCRLAINQPTVGTQTIINHAHCEIVNIDK